MGKRHEYSYIESKALAYIQEITAKFIMSYLSLLEQFLQQESQSSLEKKKILGLHFWLAGGSSEETKGPYSQMSCGSPDPQPGPAEGWHRAVGWPRGRRAGAALCQTQMVPTSSNPPTAGQAELPAMHRAPLGKQI